MDDFETVILGVEKSADPPAGAVKDASATESQTRVRTGWERCAGTFQFAALGMVYFALIAGRSVSVGAACPLGFIVSALALDRGIKEGKGGVVLFAILEILFFLIFATAMQGEVEHAIRSIR